MFRLLINLYVVLSLVGLKSQQEQNYMVELMNRSLSCLCMVEDEYDEEYRWFLRILDY